MASSAAIWCNLDTCGLVCAMVTYFLIAFAQYAVSSCILGPWMGYSIGGFVHGIAFNLLACLAHASHLRAMLTDPGAVSCRAQPPATELEAAGIASGSTLPVNPRRYCRKCDAYKPVRAHHCSICRRCVVKMDHHCPWVNNCVGIGNHKFFIQFISYVFAIAVYALALVAGRFMACVRDPSTCRSHSMPVVFLTVEAVLFGMFTLCMVCDQWETVTSNQTHIDRLKGEKHSSSLEINEVFGGARNGRRLRPDYFLPTRVAFPADVWEDVMGYRCRDACGLAATAVAKISGGTMANGANDDDPDSGGDIEVGDFYTGGSATVRERRSPAVEMQSLLGKENGGGSSVGGAAGSGSSIRNPSASPLHGIPGSSVIAGSAISAIAAGEMGTAAAGGVGFRDDHGTKRLLTPRDGLETV